MRVRCHSKMNYSEGNWLTSGIYALFDGDKLNYIGQAVRVFARFGNHEGRFPITRFMAVSCYPPLLNRAERASIFILQPRFNRTLICGADRDKGLIGRINEFAEDFRVSAPTNYDEKTLLTWIIDVVQAEYRKDIERCIPWVEEYEKYYPLDELILWEENNKEQVYSDEQKKWDYWHEKLSVKWSAVKWIVKSS